MRLAVQLQILDNEIENSRIGIHTINVMEGMFKDNEILFYQDKSDIITRKHTGIWIENGNNSNVLSNNVERLVAEPEIDGWLTGIELNQVQFSNVVNNFLFGLSDAIGIINDCSNTNLVCNWMEESIWGIVLTSAKLTTQGGTNDPWDNIWTNMGNPLNDISGTLDPFANAIIWFHQNGPGSIYAPDGDQLLVDPDPFEIPNVQLDCEHGEPSGDEEMQAGLVAIIEDSSSNSSSVEIQYLEDKYIYDVSKNIDIDTLSTMNDSLLYGKLQEIVLTSISDFDEVDSLLNIGQFQYASSVNNGINGGNVVELNAKYVNNIICSSYASDSTLMTQLDSVLLSSVAYSDPIYTGEAVYKSRGILFLEINTLNSSTGARLHIAKSTQTKSKEFSFEQCLRLLPNPGHSNLTIAIASESPELGTVVIKSSSGVLHKYIDYNKHTSWPMSIHTGDWSAGVYIVALLKENIIVDSKKWIKLE